jgi:hypothetical protein
MHLADRDPAGLRLLAAERYAARPPSALTCSCEFADIGIGLMKVAESPECPACTLFGYALWALREGTPLERSAARDYLDWLFGSPAFACPSCGSQARNECLGVQDAGGGWGTCADRWHTEEAF